MSPAGFDDDEIQVFFNQHLALESIYILGIRKDFKVLKKFAECENFHSRISVIRAMQFSNNKKVINFLNSYLLDNEKDNFTKVIAIWTLKEKGNKKSLRKIIRMIDYLSDEETGFGANIMDPRICTRFPTPKRAAANLTRFMQ